MSDNVLKIIPKEPDFIPSKEKQELASKLLHELLPEGEMWEANEYEDIHFIDQGANIESIVCPLCKHKNKFDDLYDWWQSIGEKAEESGWNQTVTIPCCSTEINILSLKFDWPAGFSRFELSIWNPNITRPLPVEIKHKIESIVGCELMEIWAHY